MLESNVKSTARKKLLKSGWFVTNLIQTSTNGIPDTLALKKGRIVFIEWKREGKTIEDEGLQEYRINQLRKQGFEVIAGATSVKDIQHLL